MSYTVHPSPCSTTTMPGDDDVSQPLLPNSSSPPASPSRYAEGRRRARDVLASKRKHYLIMGLVALDVIAVLGDVFIALVACDMGEGSEEWVGEWREGLKLAGLVFSSLFLLELLICVWAFGLGWASFLFPSPCDKFANTINKKVLRNLVPHLRRGCHHSQLHV